VKLAASFYSSVIWSSDSDRSSHTRIFHQS